MKQYQLKNLKIWFNDYVAGFYGDDEYINANIKLKEDHSRRVCDEMMYLANELDFGPNQKRIAETIALLHDIGRFKQFKKYHTYNDIRSANHAKLGLEILNENKILHDIEESEKQLIEKAIEYHSQKELPANINGELLLFSKLIRDADKIDIYFVVTDYYEQYRQDPDSFKLEVELPNEPWYSTHVVEAIMQQQSIDNRELKTWNDMKLLQLGWVYDVNFPQTLQRIKQRNFLNLILEHLPQNEDIKNVRKKIFDYVEEMLNQ